MGQSIPPKRTNALSIDVEDYYHVAAFRHDIRPQDWDTWPSRVVGNVYRILDWLDGHRLHATFFVLGWAARRHPGMVREIQLRGHEIASHGFRHELIYEIGPTRFRADIRQGKEILEDICGIPVVGFRAPSYSITERSRWALEILVEEGFDYDSSLFPIVHDLYGIPGGERFPHLVRTTSGILREFPISTLNLRLGGRDFRLPVGGGGYLRLLPATMVSRCFARLNREEGQPGILYFHPWEIDPDQPRVPSCLKSRLRHYLNLEKTFGKLEYLVQHLPFATVGEVLDDVLPDGPVPLSAGSPDRGIPFADIISPAFPPAGALGTSGEGNGKTPDHTGR